MANYNEMKCINHDDHTNEQKHVENPELSLDRDLPRKFALVDIEGFKTL
jgi:hypothetical protein